MSIGKKIKKLRIDRCITQSQLSGDKITRNMLSAIESEKALPSLDTLIYIAKQLSVPTSYLLSDDDDLFFYLKKEIIEDIKDRFSRRKYEECLDLINRLEGNDDEIVYISTICNFEIGKAATLNGSLSKAVKHLKVASELCKSTIYDTAMIESLIPMYSAIAANIQSPLLELDTKSFEKKIYNSNDLEFYKYLIQDSEFDYTNKIYKEHIEAKELIKNRKYGEAIQCLNSLDDDRKKDIYNAYVTFSIYSDLEGCYKQLGDFENAYRYASKRLTLLEAFKN